MTLEVVADEVPVALASPELHRESTRIGSAQTAWVNTPAGLLNRGREMVTRADTGLTLQIQPDADAHGADEDTRVHARGTIRDTPSHRSNSMPPCPRARDDSTRVGWHG